MKAITYQEIVEKVAQMCQEANFELGGDVMSAFRSALKTETSETGKDILGQLIENAEIAAAEQVPMCQDTGVSVFIAELGNNCIIEGEVFRMR